MLSFGRPPEDHSVLSEPPVPLQQLRALNRSLPHFQDQLFDLLGEREFEGCIPNLRDVDVTWLVDFLHTIKNDHVQHRAALRRVYRTLRNVCSTYAVLPESYIIQTSMQVPDKTFGKVIKATLNETSIAIKSLRIHTADDKSMINRRFCREVISWKNAEHQNILPLLGVSIEPLTLVSEWMENGNILDYTRKKPEANRPALLLGVAKGLACLHSYEIIHGDLKGTNVLVSHAGRPLISEFGLSTVIYGEDPSLTRGGTLRWAAPEILSGTGSISKPADIYAFSMLAFEVFAGAAPFAESPPAAVAVQVLSGGRPKRPTHSSLTNRMWDLMQNCWMESPLLRPEVREVLHQLRRSSMDRKDGTTSASILRKVLQWPDRVFSSFRTMISSERHEQSDSNIHDIKVRFYDSRVSLDSDETSPRCADVLDDSLDA